MKEVLKYLGVIFVLIGVVIIVAYNLTESPSNTYLWSALAFMICGLFAHAILNKYIK